MSRFNGDDRSFLYWLQRKNAGEFDRKKINFWQDTIFPVLFCILVIMLL